MADAEKRDDLVVAQHGEDVNEDHYANTKVLNQEARQATAAEHSLSFWQAIKTYKKAAFWSIREYLTFLQLRQSQSCSRVRQANTVSQKSRDR